MKTRARIFMASMAATMLGLLAVPIIAHALPSAVVYDATPNPLPPNVASLGYEATSTSQFGDSIHLGGTNRTLKAVTVTMSDWALYADYATDARYSGNSSTWTHPITLNVYSTAVDVNGVPTTLLATKTQSVTIPWRPVADPTCAGGTAWRSPSDHLCYNGFAFNAQFDLSSLNVTLPNDVIVGVAYNTADYGAAPIHLAGPYNSLNVGIPTGQTASVGSDDSADKVFFNTSFAGFYADGGASGVGTFREDTAWTPNGTVAFQIEATPTLTTPPTTLSQCKNDGWKTFNNPSFHNKDKCLDYVWAHSHKIKGDVKYTAYNLKREADFDMNTAENSGTFEYSDANHGSYKVKVSSVKVSGIDGWFAGKVTKASNPAWVGLWIFAKAHDNSPDQVSGSFTSQAAAEAGVAAMTNPADGPFNVTKGNLKIN